MNQDRKQDFEGMRAGAPSKPSRRDPLGVIMPLAKEALKGLPNPEDWSLMAAMLEKGYCIQHGGQGQVRIKGEPTKRSEYRREKGSPAAKKHWGPVVLESKLDKVTLILDTELQTFTEWLWRYLDPIRHRYAGEPYLKSDDHDYRLLTYSTEGRKRLYHRVTWVFLLDVILPKGESLGFTEYRTLLYEAEIGKRGAALDVFPLAPGRIEVNLRVAQPPTTDTVGMEDSVPATKPARKRRRPKHVRKRQEQVLVLSQAGYTIPQIHQNLGKWSESTVKRDRKYLRETGELD